VLAQSRQHGLSLVELMIALTMGLFLLLGLSTFLSNTLKSDSSAVKLASLDQELRAIMTLMTRDIRRAGYWGSPTFNAVSNTYSTGSLSMIGVGAASYVAGAGSIFDNIVGPPVNGIVTTATAPGCILYSYDMNGSGGTQNTTNELYGFLLNNNAILMSTGSANSCTLTGTPAPTNAWDYLSDQKNTNITALSFTETDSAPVYLTGTSGPNIRTRQITITLTGQPKNAAGIADTSITQTLTETVKVENDLFSPN
jgi:prepilin peptidase dependent protein B